MKVLGIIGGMGPAATDLLYKRITEKTKVQCDQDHVDMIILSHASMPDRTDAILKNDTKEVEKKLKKDVRFLTKAGVSAIAIPCNTSHYFIDKLQKCTKVPIINMVRETVLHIKDKGKKKVCVLATDGTIMTGIYEKELIKNGIECVLPDKETQKTVMKIIYDQIKKGQPGNMDDFNSVDRFIKEKDCDGAILACTELSVLRNEEQLSDFYTDALEVLCEKAIISCNKILR